MFIQLSLSGVESMPVDIDQSRKTIHTLDLNFMGLDGTIAAYLIPHSQGAVLIECGPGSTINALETGLKKHGYSIADITDVFLTHIHLDHAGAAGWLAQQGALIHVHPVGAPHLLDPQRLLASASRIYGQLMDTLWGEFLPVPKSRLSVLQDGDEVKIDDRFLRALDTPGHANHHLAYIFEDICFSGDIGGVRLPGPNHLRLPMPPPEFHLKKWQQSLKKLSQEEFNRIAPTHFGIYSDTGWHLSRVAKALDDAEHWMESVMPQDLPVDDLQEEFVRWTRHISLQEGLDADHIHAYETTNPSWMSAHGIHRYWKNTISG
jgi:glyoxylase-like metal-dependent hydrolase (beta-lactamase superfamily II)